MSQNLKEGLLVCLHLDQHLCSVLTFPLDHRNATAGFRCSVRKELNFSFTVYLYKELNNLRKKIIKSKASAGSANATEKNSKECIRFSFP